MDNALRFKSSVPAKNKNLLNLRDLREKQKNRAAKMPLL